VRRPALLPLALLLAGCPTPPVERPGPPPTAAQLIQHLRDRAARIKALRTEAKVDYLAEKGDRIKLSMTFLTELPSRLRIDAENPLGGTIASLATDGKTFQLLDSRENRFLSGEAAPCNLARLIRIRLAPADLIAVIQGGAPILGQPTVVEWDPENGGHEVLVLRGEGGVTERIELTPKTWDVASAEATGPDGKVIYRVIHEEFSDEGGLRLPRRSHLFDPSHAADAKIRYKEREANPTVPANAFHLDAPSGLPTETVSCTD
jgi:hypothetical protein